ncbi:unnamed protein product [Caenorhabditis brenneri]
MKTVLIIVFLIVGAFGSPPWSIDCTQDKDCFGGRKCLRGHCSIMMTEKTCVRDSDCSGYRQCSYGKCVDLTHFQAKILRCQHDEDCSSGKVNSPWTFETDQFEGSGRYCHTTTDCWVHENEWCDKHGGISMGICRRG